MIELIIALICAALSGMGVGGGGLLLIYLTLATDMAQRQAQLYNLIFFLAASMASLTVHVCRRRIRPGIVALISLGGVPGAVLGSFLSRAAGDTALGYILGGFLFVSGALSFFGGKKSRDNESSAK